MKPRGTAFAGPRDRTYRRRRRRARPIRPSTDDAGAGTIRTTLAAELETEMDDDDEGEEDEEEEEEETTLPPDEHWPCAACTFINMRRRFRCEICETSGRERSCLH